MTPSELLRLVKSEAEQLPLDFDRAYEFGWFVRPFTADEIDQHPDRERIVATVDALSRWLVAEAIAKVLFDLREQEREP